MALRILSKSFLSQRLATPIRHYATKKYTSSHEWIEINKDVATIGITDYAQNALGDVVYVEVPEVGARVEFDETVGVVESVKSTSDIYSPLTGEITAANSDVVKNTKLINRSPEKDGWLFKVKFEDQEEVNALLDEADYKKLTESDH
ncbi:glycine cleavage system H-protein subunit [Coemansia aciculifera]|uniref:Glycine cleavage system H protein n=1 Tax=Coemansia aciculifera TaxID=417176 RepID=A0A9W8IL59_9FUNG|nr:glycine cleavage system H-protein subunit [Coemansia aciculifera]KAJ2874843.1 glycine cleavage system H-protein subunit [Coemansia aciculifera]